MNWWSVCFKRLLVAAGLAAILSSFSLAQQSLVQSAVVTQPLITQAVDETRLTVLKGNTHRLARPQFDLGTAPATLPMQRMLLVLKRSAQQEYALRALLDNQQDKHSPSYPRTVRPTVRAYRRRYSSYYNLAAVARLSGGNDEGPRRAGIFRLCQPSAGSVPHHDSQVRGERGAALGECQRSVDSDGVDAGGGRDLDAA
jgi:hypothetical protein